MLSILALTGGKENNNEIEKFDAYCDSCGIVVIKGLRTDPFTKHQVCAYVVILCTFIEIVRLFSDSVHCTEHLCTFIQINTKILTCRTDTTALKNQFTCR